LHTALAAEGGGRNPVTSSFELIAAGAGGEKVRITRKGPTGLGDTIVVRLPTASMDMPLDDASKKFGEYFNSNTNELSMVKSVFNEKHKVEMEIEVLGDLYKFPVEFGPYTSKSDFTIKFPTQFLKDFGEFKILRNTQVRDITNEALRYQCRNKDSAGQFVDDPKCNVVTNKIDCEKLSCDWTDSPPPATLDQCVNICSARDIKRTGSVGNYIYTPNTLPGYKIYSKTTLGNSKTNYAKAGGQKLTGNSISTADLEATEVKIDKDSWMKSGKPSFIRNNFIKCGSAGKIEIKDENGGDLVSKCSNNTTQCLTEKTDKECSRYITLDRSKCSTMICPTNFRADSAKLATDCKGVPCKVDDKGTCCIENTCVKKSRADWKKLGCDVEDPSGTTVSLLKTLSTTAEHTGKCNITCPPGGNKVFVVKDVWKPGPKPTCSTMTCPSNFVSLPSKSTRQCTDAPCSEANDMECCKAIQCKPLTLDQWKLKGCNVTTPSSNTVNGLGTLSTNTETHFANPGCKITCLAPGSNFAVEGVLAISDIKQRLTKCKVAKPGYYLGDEGFNRWATEKREWEYKQKWQPKT